MQNNDDILSAFDIVEDTNIDEVIFIQEEKTTSSSLEVESLRSTDTQIQEEDILVPTPLVENSSELASPIVQSKKTFTKKSKDSFVFLVKYFSTSICIFWILMVGANYSAYWNLAYSIIYAEEMQVTKNSLIESVAASNIEEKASDSSKVNTFRNVTTEESTTQKKTKSMHSMSHLTTHPSQSWVDLGIEITPYENRIIIPTIGKNIPLIDITQKKVEWVDELNDIFMKELENGVIRYPGSAKPGDAGNSFIFGHSSNFPWMEWEYNDVFALLDKVTFDDEVVVYYGQEKHTYKIRTKNVISPGDVSILQKEVAWDKSKLTLMTCWPIGTTLNRLVLTWELISVE